MTEENNCIRTTIYIPRKLHESVKLMAILTRSNVSEFMRIALREKINQLKEQKNNVSL